MKDLIILYFCVQFDWEFCKHTGKNSHWHSRQFTHSMSPWRAAQICMHSKVYLSVSLYRVWLWSWNWYWRKYKFCQNEAILDLFIDPMWPWPLRKVTQTGTSRKVLPVLSGKSLAWIVSQTMPLLKMDGCLTPPDGQMTHYILMFAIMYVSVTPKNTMYTKVEPCLNKASEESISVFAVSCNLEGFVVPIINLQVTWYRFWQIIC